MSFKKSNDIGSNMSFIASKLMKNFGNLESKMQSRMSMGMSVLDSEFENFTDEKMKQYMEKKISLNKTQYQQMLKNLKPVVFEEAL